MAIQPYQEDSNVSTPIKRIRWATQRLTGSSERKKRHGIMDRFHKRSASSEKKSEATGGTHLDALQEEPEGSEDGNDHESSRRRIFFNIPLPDDAKDENGRPLQTFERNKIRTAKYTPLSFIPKNLWFQFHNIANIYFLFVIILAVRSLVLLGCTEYLRLQPTDLPNLRCDKPCTRRGTFDLHPLCYKCKRRY